jgi:hypothetical protein
MKIKQLFSKDIERKINPAVVVSDQDSTTIITEIEEYVFTNDIIENMYRFLSNIFNYKDGKTGIWLNGYYGSGKSHFIKYIYYCLHPDYSEKAFNHLIEGTKDTISDFSEATPSNFLQLKKQITNSKIDNMMFNIDAVSGLDDGKDKLPRILYNVFNGFRGYNTKNITLATLVEKHLDKIGKFDEFKKIMNESKHYNWEKDASTIISLNPGTVLDVVESLDPTIDKVSIIKKLHHPDDISIKGDLIPEFIEFLDSKPEDYRFVFLIDEVSQYIGSNTNLLLNLQTIIEEIGAKCNNKLWLAATAQQSLEDMTGNDASAFGKILGRFETRISLQSQDASYITKKRILDKNSEGIKTLKSFYDSNKDAIEHQFHFSHDLYKGFSDIDDFNLSYPFVPYQFRLISDVFDSFSNINYVIKEVKDNERSVLGITHFTVKEHAEKDIGFFMPFDAFFNKQFRQNLTHTARRIIDRANQLDFIKKDTFATRVVNTLFMIANLSDDKRIAFPSNLDNLCILLMQEPDTNRLELQSKIQTVLEKLVEQNIIREEEGQYHFFKEDEIEVADLIKNTRISTDDKLTALYDNIFSSFLTISSKFSYGNNNFKLAVSFDDKQIFPNGDVNVRFSFFSTMDIHQKALTLSQSDLIICIDQILQKDKKTLKEFDHYVRTRNYITRNFDSARGTRKNTINNFATRNNLKLQELQSKFKIIFSKSPLIISQNVVDGDGISASKPNDRLKEILTSHFEKIYKKHNMIDGYPSSNDALRRAAIDTQILSDKSLSTTESEVDRWLQLKGDFIELSEVIKHFSLPPFGWKDISTISVVLSLSKKGKRSLEWRNNPIEGQEFYQNAIKTSERSVIYIKPAAQIDIKQIHDAINAYNTIFNENYTFSDDAKYVYSELLKKLQHKLAYIKHYNEDYSSQPFGKVFRSYYSSLDDLCQIRDSIKLFKNLNESKDTLKQSSDDCKELVEFVDHQFENYKTIRKFYDENKMNFADLNEAHQKKAEDLAIYFQSDHLPSAQFPQIKKAYTELKTAVKDIVEVLRAKAIEEYEKVHDELEKEIKEKKAPEDIIESKASKIKSLKSEKSVSKIRLAIEQTSSYKAKGLKVISDIVGKKSVTFKITSIGLPSQIENEDQLDEYLQKLKNKMLDKMQDDVTIIIE